MNAEEGRALDAKANRRQHAADMDAIWNIYNALMGLLEMGNHGDDCIFRCLTPNTCRADHYCDACGDGKADEA